MLGCQFSLEVYATNAIEKATKCYLKSTDVLLGADGYVQLL